MATSAVDPHLTRRGAASLLLGHRDYLWVRLFTIGAFASAAAKAHETGAYALSGYPGVRRFGFQAFYMQVTFQLLGDRVAPGFTMPLLWGPLIAFGVVCPWVGSGADVAVGLETPGMLAAMVLTAPWWSRGWQRIHRWMLRRLDR